MNPFWASFKPLRRGVSYWLPALGSTTSAGYPCVQVAWVKWALLIGWRGL